MVAVALKVFDRYVEQRRKASKIAVVYLPITCEKRRSKSRLNVTNLERLAALLFDAIVNLDPQEFDGISDAVARYKTEASLHGGCPEFVTLFGAIERATTGL